MKPDGSVTRRSLPGKPESPRGYLRIFTLLSALLLCSIPSEAASLKLLGETGPVARVRGPVLVTTVGGLPSTAYAQGSGQILSRTEAAGRIASNILRTPDLGDPNPEAVAGAVEFVIAPFAAAYGALSAGRQRPAPEELERAQKDLATSLGSVARQEAFLEAFRDMPGAILAECPDGVSAAPLPPAQRDHLPVLQARLDSLRLDAVGKSEKRVLKITATGSLLDPSTHQPLAIRTVQFTSGEDLYLDWTLKGAVQSVARTGYARIAQRLVEELSTGGSAAPLRIGTGFARAERKPPGPQLATVRYLHEDPAPAEAALYRVSVEDALGVYSLGASAHTTVPAPISREETLSDIERETSYALDGLDEHPNAVVQVLACAAAVPVGLWKQAAEGLFRPSRAQTEKAQAVLRQAALATAPPREIAAQVVQCLAPHTQQPVLVANQPASPSGQPDATTAHTADPNAPVWIRASDRRAPRAGSARPDLGVEIKVKRATLACGEGFNPKMRLEVDAEVRAFRTRTGDTLTLFSVEFRSAGRTYSNWARDDARLFRTELSTCYRQIADSVANRLAEDGVIVPKGSRYPILAQAR